MKGNVYACILLLMLAGHVGVAGWRLAGFPDAEIVVVTWRDVLIVAVEWCLLLVLAVFALEHRGR